MFPEILKNIESFSDQNIQAERKFALQKLVDYINKKRESDETIRLNFICTHNSRRSHLAQIWAQAMAYYFDVKNIACYSGGTEATAMFPMVVETLIHQGFQIQKLNVSENPVYTIKFTENEPAIICFSKKYDDAFNPKSNFGAIMTCDHADENCPIVQGAETRFPIQYGDPKLYDGMAIQSKKYAERSLEIGEEMWWVFKSII
ncbi:MAG TPA: protein-tyrosine-phosphatase [Saprospiraceae bacterium]|jgi:arsenate reductase|nr:protein-tyrosine-phosphatase [Saprospiraceae bacterium]